MPKLFWEKRGAAAQCGAGGLCRFLKKSTHFPLKKKYGRGLI